MNTLHRPNRNEPQPVCLLLVGQTGVYTAPKALAADTVGYAGEGGLDVFYGSGVGTAEKTVAQLAKGVARYGGHLLLPEQLFAERLRIHARGLGAFYAFPAVPAGMAGKA